MTFPMQKWLDAAARAQGLTLRETRVLWLMSRYANFDTGAGIRPSTETISRELGIHPAHIRGARGAICALVARGWLVRPTEATKNTPAVYRLGFGSSAGAGGEPGEHSAMSPAGGDLAKSQPMVDVADSARAETATSGSGDVAVLATSDVAVLATSDVADSATSDVADSATQSAKEQLIEQPRERGYAHAGAHTRAHTGAREATDTTKHEPVQGVIVQTTPGADLAAHADAVLQEAARLSQVLATSLRSRGMVLASADRKSANAITMLLHKGATPEQIEHVIRWGTNDSSWWGRNVTDGASFARHYDRLVAEARSEITRNAHDGRTARQRTSDEQSARWRAMPPQPPPAKPAPLTGEEQLAAILAKQHA